MYLQYPKEKNTEEIINFAKGAFHSVTCRCNIREDGRLLSYVVPVVFSFYCFDLKFVKYCVLNSLS